PRRVPRRSVALLHLRVDRSTSPTPGLRPAVVSAGARAYLVCTISMYTSAFGLSSSSLWFFFFQAEDGIRDFHVTGVQTCALPISGKTSKWCCNDPLRRNSSPCYGNNVKTTKSIGFLPVNS